VCRHDAFQGKGAFVHDVVQIKKIVFTRRLAEFEADRLNKLNSEKNVLYFVLAARIECEPEELSDSGSTP